MYILSHRYTYIVIFFVISLPLVTFSSEKQTPILKNITWTASLKGRAKRLIPYAGSIPGIVALAAYYSKYYFSPETIAKTTSTLTEFYNSASPEQKYILLGGSAAVALYLLEWLSRHPNAVKEQINATVKQFITKPSINFIPDNDDIKTTLTTKLISIIDSLAKGVYKQNSYDTVSKSISITNQLKNNSQIERVLRLDAKIIKQPKEASGILSKLWLYISTSKKINLEIGLEIKINNVKSLVSVVNTNKTLQEITNSEYLAKVAERIIHTVNLEHNYEQNLTQTNTNNPFGTKKLTPSAITDYITQELQKLSNIN
jgi:hypothetical protein